MQSPHNLVVVDDDDMVHERIERSFRQTPWSVTSFLDPEDALIQLRGRAMPNLLIVDNRMPRMDGTDFIDLLDWPLAMVTGRVYLCSGIHPTTDICKRAEQRGAKILSKDILFERRQLLSFLAGFEFREVSGHAGRTAI